MVIGVNGTIGQNVINHVALDFKTDHEFVMILHLLTVGMIVMEHIPMKHKCATSTIAQVRALINRCHHLINNINMPRGTIMFLPSGRNFIGAVKWIIANNVRKDVVVELI